MHVANVVIINNKTRYKKDTGALLIHTGALPNVFRTLMAPQKVYDAGIFGY